MGYFEVFSTTRNLTQTNCRQTVDEAFRLWENWLKVGGNGIELYNEKSEEFGNFLTYWCEGARDFSSSIMLASNGMYKSAVEALRNFLELTIDLLTSLGAKRDPFRNAFSRKNR